MAGHTVEYGQQAYLPCRSVLIRHHICPELQSNGPYAVEPDRILTRDSFQFSFIGTVNYRLLECDYHFLGLGERQSELILVE